MCFYHLVPANDMARRVAISLKKPKTKGRHKLVLSLAGDCKHDHSELPEHRKKVTLIVTFCHKTVIDFYHKIKDLIY